MKFRFLISNSLNVLVIPPGISEIATILRDDVSDPGGTIGSQC